MRSRLAACALAAVLAFVLYDGTLLPGQDLGDTASFQATAGTRVLTPRQAYPLYYATGNPFVWWLRTEPARALNLASAAFGALAVGLLTCVAADLGASLLAGLFAALLFAGSYTFWTQAIIAEVYALHAFMMGACLVSILAWARRPTLARLAVFFLLYAVSFGNHLSMILLAPGFMLFLLLMAPGGALAMLRPRVILLALLMAIAGALPYLWNLASLWVIPYRTGGLPALITAFWFDVTKSDWRAAMVMGVPEGAFTDRTAMYWFDLRQQFGLAGALLAAAGAVVLLWKRPRAGLAALLLYAINVVFAFTYNVGDTHVFYLPSHYFVALMAGCAIGALWRNIEPIAVRAPNGVRPVLLGAIAAAILAYPLYRIADTWPAVDRGDDAQPTDFFNRLTAGLTGDREILASDLNWQLHNGLDYYTKYTKPALAAFDTSESLLTFPFLVASNREIGRDIVLTAGSASLVASAYGPLFDLVPDTRVKVEPLARRVADVAAGTPYVLAWIEAYPDIPVDEADISRTASTLSAGTSELPIQPCFAVMAGEVGARPVTVKSSHRPFRLDTRIGGLRIDVRMESWMPADTIRRMGFGHVIVDGRHALTLDRGVSFVSLDRAGHVRRVEYLGGLFAPQPRYVIPGRRSTKDQAPGTKD